MAETDPADSIENLLSAFGYEEVHNDKEDGIPARNVNVTDAILEDFEDEQDGIPAGNASEYLPEMHMLLMQS